MDYTAPTGSADPNASYQGKNVSAGTQGSKVPPGAVENPQREIVAIEKAAGLTPSNTDKTQLLQAVSRGILLGTFGGTANVLTAVIQGSVAIPAISAYMRFRGVVASTNTGGVTLTLTGFTSSPGSAALLRSDGSVLQAGDMVAGKVIDFYYDGSAYRIGGAVRSEIVSVIPPSANTLTKYTAAGTYSFTVPAGVTQIIVEAVGGGAGGSAGSSSIAGGGGGSGAYGYGVYKVVPGTVYTVVVGAHGAGSGSGGAFGNSAGDTSFGSLLTVLGAKVMTTGGFILASGQPGGLVGTGGLLNFPGNYGQDGTPGSSYLGGAGGSTKFGNGGRAGSPNTGAATASGTGGGGSYAGGPTGATTPGNSGDGADGAVFVYFNTP